MGFSVNGGSTTVRDALHRTLPVPREVRYTIMYNSPRFSLPEKMLLPSLRRVIKLLYIMLVLY